MPKIITSLVLFTALSLLLSPVATIEAVKSLEDSIKGELNAIERVYDPYDDISSESISITIARLVRSALAFIGIILIVLMTYAGFIWMTAAGNDEQIAKAKKIMTSAFVGAVIVFAAYMISYFIIDQLLLATTEEGIADQ